MLTVNPHLSFNGNAEAAFSFYKTIFGGTFESLMRYKQMPDGCMADPAAAEKIMHVSFPVGNSILMGADVISSMRSFTPGDTVTLSLHATNEAEARPLFDKLSQGGQVIMPLDTAFWGGYFGALTDPYGIQWMITCD